MSPTATAIPPTHVPCVAEWPALSPSRISSHETDGDWELLSELQDESSTSTSTSAQTQTQTQTSFEREAVRIVEQFLDTENSTASATKITTPFCLKHAQSSPNFHTILEESDDNDAVLVGTTGNSSSTSTSTSQPEDGVGSLASSSMVMVPESPSLVSTESSWSTVSKISFRDAIMKEKPQETNHNANNNNNNNNHLSAVHETGPPHNPAQQPQKQKVVKKRPKFVVTPIKRCVKSTGDLRSLARIAECGGNGYGYGGNNNNDDDTDDIDLIVGDTDAELYYSQKSQGKLGRKNGQKTRPDEAKRLQITMAKKEDQRQRQKAAATKKR